METRDIGQFVAKAALPFGGSSSKPPPTSTTPPTPADSARKLTLEQHASLAVELDVAPDRADDTLQRYQLTLAEYRAIDAEWRERLHRDVSALVCWNRAFVSYRSWFLSTGGAKNGGHG